MAATFSNGETDSLINNIFTEFLSCPNSNVPARLREVLTNKGPCLYEAYVIFKILQAIVVQWFSKAHWPHQGDIPWGDISPNNLIHCSNQNTCETKTGIVNNYMVIRHMAGPSRENQIDGHLIYRSMPGTHSRCSISIYWMS